MREFERGRDNEMAKVKFRVSRGKRLKEIKKKSWEGEIFNYMNLIGRT